MRRLRTDELHDLDDPALEDASRLVSALSDAESGTKADAISETVRQLKQFEGSPRAWFYIAQLELYRGRAVDAASALLRSYELRYKEGPRLTLSLRIREALTAIDPGSDGDNDDGQ